MDGTRLAQLRYFLLGSEHSDVRDSAYRFWKSFWTDVYRAVGNDEGPHDDDFHRQTYLSVITENDEVVALHTYTIFDLASEADRNHSYFRRYYSTDAIDALRRSGVKRAMTMEYFSVNRDWRSKHVGMSFASVVAGLGVRLAQNIGVDAIVSAARTDVGADRIGKAFGAETVATTQVNGVNTELLVFHRDAMHAHADATIEQWVQHFWDRREHRETKSAA